MKKYVVVSGKRWSIYPVDSIRSRCRKRRYIVVNGIRWYIYPIVSN